MSSTALARDRYGRALRRPEVTDGYRNSTMFRRVCGAITRTLEAFVEGIAEARRMARAYDELAQMSEPELHDTGINRADIPTLIFGTCRAQHPFSIPPQAAGKKESPPLDRNDQPGDQGASI